MKRDVVDVSFVSGKFLEQRAVVQFPEFDFQIVAAGGERQTVRADGGGANPAEMGLDGAKTEIEPPGNLYIRESKCNERKNVSFTSAEARGVPRRISRFTILPEDKLATQDSLNSVD